MHVKRPPRRITGGKYSQNRPIHSARRWSSELSKVFNKRKSAEIREGMINNSLTQTLMVKKTGLLHWQLDSGACRHCTVGTVLTSNNQEFSGLQKKTVLTRLVKRPLTTIQRAGLGAIDFVTPTRSRQHGAWKVVNTGHHRVLHHPPVTIDKAPVCVAQCLTVEMSCHRLDVAASAVFSRPRKKNAS